jgi:uncharacterized protein YfdQ (DUF2303 family)
MSDYDHMTAEAQPTNAGVAAGLARLALDPAHRTLTGPGEAEFILLRDENGGERLQELTQGGLTVVKPGRIKLGVTIETEQSLIEYANSFKAANSVLFAAISTDTMVCVLDYHASSRDDVAAADSTHMVSPASFSPDFTDHRATLHLPRSMEWAAWAGIDGKLLPQLDFCRFLEENREDIVSPDAATVLEAARDLQTMRKVDFRSVVREDSENVRIEYAEDADARSKTDTTLPAEFKLRLPVYFDGEEVEVFALLRWKVEDGKLWLGVKLKRAERIRQATFKQAVVGIVEATGVRAVFGAIPSKS